MSAISRVRLGARARLVHAHDGLGLDRQGPVQLGDHPRRFPALGQFATLPLALQATIVAFACLDLLAAIGLWLAAPWGGVLWLLCAVVEALSPFLSPRAARSAMAARSSMSCWSSGYFALELAGAHERA